MGRFWLAVGGAVMVAVAYGREAYRATLRWAVWL